MGMPSDLVLIRHGESEMNAAHTRVERGEPITCLQELRLPEALWETNMYLHERDWGDLVGLPFAERLEQFADVFDQREKDPLFPRIPNGESLAGECARIELVLDYLAREYPGKRVLVVTHGELMWCFRLVIEKLAPWKFGDMYRDKSHWIPNCGILHYSRRDPMTDIIGWHLAWMRTVHPTESFGMGPWTRIHRELWTAEELIRAAEQTPRLLA